MATTAPVKKHGSKKGQNIRVFVRCRPLNSIEKNAKSLSCVECSSREVIVRERPLDKFTKTFSFDKVFGPESKQIDVYKAVAKNSVEEVLSGFNCTIFAYGQTGTGKTFTMEGDRTPDNTSWDDDPLAGIIPRCVNHLFDELRLQKLEFTMRVSFLELYNEEIFDLLSPRDDLSKLRLYEDASRKGSCIIQGLEEVLVRSKANVYEILEKGSKKRQTAATLMNAHSSRSHTVFTVTLHIRENTEDGDELLKTGKLHLVDLAGSENISRSGAVDKRAREAGNINQSLLTLGRVITALEEKTPHIPYRESKLTRLLQDALGGRTKTSIVATISPAAINLEETLSTLDYAHRAKNIQNKPEVNQKLNKKELIGEYSQEIERLRLDLMAMREKSGVYLANENYQDMIQTIESQAQEIAEKITMIRSLEEGIENKTNELNSCTSKLDMLSEELNKLQINLKETSEVLSCTQNLLHHTTVERDEQKHLVDAHSKTEVKLQNNVRALVEVADTTTDHVKKLHDKIERNKNVEKANQEVGVEFMDAYNREHSKLKDQIQETFNHQKDATDSMKKRCCTGITHCKSEVEKVNEQIAKSHQFYQSLHRDLHSLCMKQVEDYVSGMNSFTSCKVQQSQEHNELVKNLESAFLTSLQKLDTWISKEGTVMSRMQKSLSEKISKLGEELNAFTRQQEEMMTSAEKELLPLIDSVRSIASNDKTSLKNVEERVHSKVQDLEGKFDELASLVSSMRKIPNSIKVDISDYKASKMPDLDIVEETSDMMKNKMKALSTDQKNASTTLESAVASVTSDLRSIVKDFDAESEENVRHLGESRCELESVGSRFFSETIVYLDELVKDAKTYSNDVEKKQKENSKTYAEKVEEATTSVEKNKEELSQRIEAVISSNEEDLSFLKDNCSSLFESIQAQTTSLQDELDSQRMQIMDLFSEKMVQNIPTGQTPVRQEYKFSRLVAATSPHDVILQRLRAASLSSASKIPLPYDTDIEDESSSPSSESSRLSASDSSHLDEDANDLPSNPGSTTDLRIISNNSKHNKNVQVFAMPTVPISRENSMVSLSRSSSTSSIPESKDKENVSGQRGSTKKRGLKQPTNYSSSIAEKTHGQESNTRSRRILGMQN